MDLDEKKKTIGLTGFTPKETDVCQKVMGLDKKVVYQNKRNSAVLFAESCRRLNSKWLNKVSPLIRASCAGPRGRGKP